MAGPVPGVWGGARRRGRARARGGGGGGRGRGAGGGGGGAGAAAFGEAECAAAAPGGAEGPPPRALRALKRFSRASPVGLRAAYSGLMARLREQDCLVRVHALEAMHMLTLRSKLFRDLLARDFCEFLDLTVGTHGARALPGPADAARELRLVAARCTCELAERFGAFYSAFTIGAWFVARRVRLRPEEFEDEHERRRAAQAAEREVREQQAVVQQFYAIRYEYPAFMTDARLAAQQLEECLSVTSECQRANAEPSPTSVSPGCLGGYRMASAGRRAETSADARRLKLDPSLESTIRETLLAVRSQLLPKAQGWERTLVQMARPVSGGALSRMQMLQELVHLRTRFAASMPALDEALVHSHESQGGVPEGAGGGALQIPVDGVGDVEFEEVARDGTGEWEPAPVRPTEPAAAEGGGVPDLDNPWHVPGGLPLATSGLEREKDRLQRGGTPPPGLEFAPEPPRDPAVRNFAPLKERAPMQPRSAGGAESAGGMGQQGSSRLTQAQREDLCAKAPIVAPGPHLQYWGREMPVNDRGMEIEGHWGAWDGNATIAKDHTIAQQLTLAPEFYTPAPVEVRVCGAPLKDGTFCQRRDRHTCPFHGPIGTFGIPRNIKKAIAWAAGGLSASHGGAEAPGAPGHERSRRAGEASGSGPRAGELAAPVTAREQRRLDRAHNESILMAASGDTPPPDERESQGSRSMKRKSTARERLSRKLGNPRVVAAAADHLDRLDDTRRRSNFSEQW